MIGGQPVYVYGVVSSGATITLPADGVANGEPRLLESDGLAAIVSSVPTAGLRVRRRDLNAHLRALEQISEQTTVLPCRFGTVLGSEEDVRAHLLDGRRDELHYLLQRLEGQVQLNVKAEYDEQEVLNEIVTSDARIARLGQRTQELGDAGYYENIQLGELVAAQLAARRREDAARIHARLAAAATDVVVDEREVDALLVLKASFLVDGKRTDAFDAEVEAIAKDEGPTIRFELIGPLPSTAFVSLGEDG